MKITESWGSGLKRVAEEIEEYGLEPLTLEDCGIDVAVNMSRKLRKEEDGGKGGEIKGKTTANPPLSGSAHIKAIFDATVKNALINALKDFFKDAENELNDDVIDRIIEVYSEIRKNRQKTLNAISGDLGYSRRSVDNYVRLLKKVNVLKRKNGRKHGEWETFV